MTDKYGRTIYPVVVKFIEFGLDSNGNKTNDNITSQSVVYSHNPNPRESGYGKRTYLSDPGTAIYLGSNVVDGYIPYTFKGQYNKLVKAMLGG